MKLLDVFKFHGYSNEIGPGVYDIHSPVRDLPFTHTTSLIKVQRVPSEQEIKDRIAAMAVVLPTDLMGESGLGCFSGRWLMWAVINPDCGLKTRGWKETEESLNNLVSAARWARATYA